MKGERLQIGKVSVLTGDCLSVLKTLPAGSVHCVVTSPPYWGLRDYGTAAWVGGDLSCDHVPPPTQPRNARSLGKFHGGTDAGNASREPDKRSVCGKCGARRIDSQLGLESTPVEYVEKMVAVFREVRRVLRDDGTLWLNLGDSYAGGGNYRGVHSEDTLSEKQRSNGGARGVSQLLGAAGKDFGLEPKNLVGIPWRVAFALQADGWYLRQDIIWSKPNPMPESVRDRCTKAHEYLFLLAKSERYYFDAEAIAEPSSEVGTINSFGNKNAEARGVDELTGNMRLGVMYETKPTRNKRSVWTVTTQPYREAHFATFPPKLIEPCILAGCPEDGIVLDPFAGAGTTGDVAIRAERRAILIELSPKYADLISKRLTTARYKMGLFA